MQALAQPPAPIAIAGIEAEHTPSTPPFDRVYEANFAFVCRSLRRLGAGPSDVPDLAQEVFLVVLRRLGDFDAGRPMRPWLFGIAYKVFVDHRRLARHRHEVVGSNPEARDPRAGETGDAADAAEGRAQVLEALLALEIDQRAVLVLHDIEDFTMPEIAEALSIPLNTGYSRLRLARERFEKTNKRLRAQRSEVR
jgi:RNA polymerase sigma-70 factor (ECF subfamily)